MTWILDDFGQSLDCDRCEKGTWKGQEAERFAGSVCLLLSDTGRKGGRVSGNALSEPLGCEKVWSYCPFWPAVSHDTFCLSICVKNVAHFW